MGTAKEYRVPLQELQDQMKSRLEVATILRQYKLANIKNKYEAEEQAIRQNFEVTFLHIYWYVICYNTCIF